MFERYTEVARRVIFYSRYMANQAGSPEIETEHLLLGLLRTDMVLARRFLGSPWAAEEIWREIERRKPVRATTPGSLDLPLSTEAKRALLLAAEEADQLSSKKIRTEHLLLGLLREEECLATALLHGRGLHLVSTREELSRNPHDDSAVEKFLREASPLPQDVVELQTRIRSIVSRMEQAIADHDFAKARSCSDEERIERDHLRLLYQEHGLSGWIFE
jgi:ATP-dependent Clp protease ATP-binding subunit ClpC